MRKIKLFVFLVVLTIAGLGVASFINAGGETSLEGETAYLPFFRGFDCGSSSSKKAGTHPFNADQSNLSTLFKQLCLQKDFYWMNWGPTYGYKHGGYKISVIWCDRGFVTNWITDTPRNAGIYVIFMNEPDRPDQCSRSVEEIVIAYKQVSEHCTNCTFIGPAYSNACRSSCLIEFWELCKLENCDLSRLQYSLHIYPDHTRHTSGDKVQYFYEEIQSAGLPTRPVWVTEIGAYLCGEQMYPNPIEFSSWLSELEIDDRVVAYFGYTTWHKIDPKEPCNFYGFFDFGTDNITPAGVVYRSVGGAGDEKSINPYPAP